MPTLASLKETIEIPVTSILNHGVGGCMTCGYAGYPCPEFRPKGSPPHRTVYFTSTKIIQEQHFMTPFKHWLLNSPGQALFDAALMLVLHKRFVELKSRKCATSGDRLTLACC